MERGGSHDDDPVMRGVSSANAQSSVPARRIFIIRQASRLSANDTQSKTVRHILVFDDHPDTLRLILGDSADESVDDAPDESAGWWAPFLGWAMVICLMTLMFLPLWQRLRW
jgi:hypothetical protein